MSGEKTMSRWWIVFGALLVQICLGAIYAWSVFRKPLEALFGITPTQASLPFSIVLIFFSVAMVIGGRLQDRFGPRPVAIAGGILLAAGMVLASVSSNITLLALSYGVVSGIGIGFAYVCPISAGVKWFPDKRGLVIGLAIFGFGAGAFFIAPLAEGLIGGGPYRLLGVPLFTLPGVGVHTTFLLLGFAYLVLVTLGGLFLRNPPAGYVPEGWTPPASAPGAPTMHHYGWREMLATRQFWIIWLVYFTGSVAGLMMIGQTSPIGQELAGLDPSTAAVGVSVLAIFNALGRIFWGRVSDSVGRTPTLSLIYAINAVAVFSYFLVPGMPSLFWLAVPLVGGTFGGYLSLYPAITADFYGTRHVGINYGLVFTAYGIGGLVSNVFAPRVKELTGSYNAAFVLVGVLCVVAAVVSRTLAAPVARTGDAGR